ncbi:hypothetical protein DO97_07755 [Neosynechococcus sphagnicola sy1]|uniref:YprB ribonuclease H-like domain-containing protein n=1 Tax=Neosynechococcus sphagnicola sy1 TaxID=1497020 RepID=A0A098TJS1_9CYAN|nr:TM0106 family RecB-like putative nuclease [Neosynechococcus sphagnicola]KGF72561.1 hypothetical protein DO97_07755 [Neosynechococcus sphagnicola sy1]
MLLTDELFLDYQRCSRRAFLEEYGNADLREPASDYVLKLRQDSFTHQRQVLADLTYHQPKYAAGDWGAGAAATLALMQQGVEHIFQGVLVDQAPTGVTLVSKPDLLIRQPGRSFWGNWIYAPVEIKLGKRPKLEYQMVLTFHTQILSMVQGAWPEGAWLLLRERGLYAVDLPELLPRMQILLKECLTTLDQSEPPEVFIARNRCNLCQWFSHCYAIAQDQQHLSLLPGVTPSRYSYLQTLHLTTVESLSNIHPRTLELLPGFGREVAQKLVRQAQATLQNQAMPTLPPDWGPMQDHRVNLPQGNLKLIKHLPTAAVELYFDIEAEPERNLAYLHGVLVVERFQGATTFYPFLAEAPDGEALIWEQFLDLVGRYPDAPIFHFCPYEVQTVKRLGQLYGTPWTQIQQLLTRFIDLHDWVTRTVTLPVESYALKQIARWLGFRWRDASANGAQSIYWYTQWLATGDRQFLNAILHYNEDDCHATYHIKNWLTDFLAATLPPDS